ncbi:MAG: ribonuclease catalytic domain-containing protein [Burkholderiales bacterium]
MHVIYEESGAIKVGTILADNDSSLQIEAPHGKRSKIKSNVVLLRFDSPGAAEMLKQAEALAAEVDIDFLWECCGEAEFGFEAMAREYCGHTPGAVEAAGILLKLHSAPIYFYRKGKGRFKAAPADTLKAALAAVEKKRLQQLAIDQWAEDLAQARFPEALRAHLSELLYKPDRNKPETKALEKACELGGLSAPKLLARAGALPSSHDFHLNRFLFECFPRGTAFAKHAALDALNSEAFEALPLAAVRAFSVDDETTTEIDDAFSVTRIDAATLRVGIHIAAPGLFFSPGSALDGIARERLSTVYMPGAKITMLPPEAVERATLKEGRPCAAVSLYLDVKEEGFTIVREHSAIERVPIAANLRHSQTQGLDSAFLVGTVPAETPFSSELYFLWRLAVAREAARGKASAGGDRADYNFEVVRDEQGGERVLITERPRGTPVDKLVAEMMIHANAHWGRLLAENQVAGIYRVQSGGKVRMTTSPGEHQGLGVSHYAWMTSPLRRYVDLVNQWQLLALVRGETAPFEANAGTLLAAVHDFDATYSQYADFQWRMERYWCLRWLLQEGVQIAHGEVLRDNLVRIKNLPLVIRVPSLPELVPGSPVELEALEIDLIDAEIQCRYKAPKIAA